MNYSVSADRLKELRENRWAFQQTFLTPLDDLKSFVAVIVRGLGLQGGTLTVGQAVFEPKHLIDLMRGHSIPPRFDRGTCLKAEAADEVVSLLESAFSDWIDFLFEPASKSFAIFADHDEYTTFFVPRDATWSVWSRSCAHKDSKWLTDI